MPLEWDKWLSQKQTEKSHNPSERTNDMSDLYKLQCFPIRLQVLRLGKKQLKSIFYVKFQSKSRKETSPLGENTIKHDDV